MNKRYKRVYVEITNVCNLKCSFCPIDQRDADFMRLKEFVSIIRQVSPIAEQVCLHLMGEPLAHPELESILNLCQEFQSQVQITTNGVLISKQKNLILNSPAVRQVNFSLQSYLDNYPDKDPTEYLERVFLFLDECFAKRPELYLNLRLWNLGADTFSLNEAIFDRIEERYAININRNIEVGKIKSKKLVNRLYLHFDSRFEWPRLEDKKRSQSGRCHGLLDHFAIHADGTVVPCCLDDQKTINLGNALQKPLEEILNSELALAISDGFKQQKLVHDLCQKCTYISRFK